MIQTPGEPREQHLGEVTGTEKHFFLVYLSENVQKIYFPVTSNLKVRISNFWLLNSKISQFETLKLLEVLVVLVLVLVLVLVIFNSSIELHVN